MAHLGKQQQRMVYVITYSRADIDLFPTKKCFADAVLQAWTACGYAVQHWVVCVEEHSTELTALESTTNRPFHYHMALKLQRRGRWIQVRKYLDDEFGIKVNFSDHHNTYYSGYRYVTKEDEEPLFSEPHPDLRNAPKTESAIDGNKRKARGAAKSKKKRKKTRERALTVYDVSQIIEQRKFTKRIQVVCLAVQQKREGNTALAEFIANKGDNAVDEALSVAKEFSEAEAKLARSKKTRIDILREAKDKGCCEGCEGKWLEAAERLVESNGIPLQFFCQSVFTALEKGRGKYQNIYIHGPANCGKTFILSPLKLVYEAFCNPATGSFAWVGAEEAEIIFLNDFRWSAKVIAWADLLQALEGDIVHLPAPKNFCKRDLELSADTPFFATSDAPLVLVKGGSIDRANTEMMNVRWRFFHFWKQIPQSSQVRMEPCKHCFAKFILDNAV